MGEHIAINDHQTWVDANGQGPPVLVLHGGFSNSDGLLDVFVDLAEEYRVVGFDRRGHGRTADTHAPFHYSDMALGRRGPRAGRRRAGSSGGISDGGGVASVAGRQIWCSPWS